MEDLLSRFKIRTDGAKNKKLSINKKQKQKWTKQRRRTTKLDIKGGLSTCSSFVRLPDRGEDQIKNTSKVEQLKQPSPIYSVRKRNSPQICVEIEGEGGFNRTGLGSTLGALRQSTTAGKE